MTNLAEVGVHQLRLHGALVLQVHVELACLHNIEVVSWFPLANNQLPGLQV